MCSWKSCALSVSIYALSQFYLSAGSLAFPPGHSAESRPARLDADPVRQLTAASALALLPGTATRYLSV